MKVERSHTPEEINLHLAELTRLQNLSVFTPSEQKQADKFRIKLQSERLAGSSQRWFLSDEYVGRDRTLMIELPDGELFVTYGLAKANMLLRFLGGDNCGQSVEGLAIYIYGSDESKRVSNIDTQLTHLRRSLADYGWTIAPVTSEIPKKGRTLQQLIKMELTDVQMADEVAKAVVVEIPFEPETKAMKDLDVIVLPDGQRVIGETDEQELILMAVSERAEKYEGVVSTELAQILDKAVDKKFFKELNAHVNVLNQLLKDKGWKIAVYDIAGTQGSLKCLKLIKVQDDNGESLEERPNHVKNKQQRIASEIDMKDKEARQRTQEYLTQVMEARLTFPITGATLNRTFGRLTRAKVENAVSKGYISPAKDHDGHYRFILAEALVLLHWSDARNPLRSRFNSDFAEGYQLIAVEENKSLLS